MLLSDLIIWYLFLGGVGAGTCIVAIAIGVFSRKKPSPISTQLFSLRPALFIVSILSLSIGTACLLKDLFHPDNASSLYTSPSFSIISIGTFALTVLMICTTVLTFFELFAPSSIATRPRIILEIFTGADALAVATYTGIYLYQIPAVPLWNSLCIPILFPLSALSTGIGALCITAALTPQKVPNPYNALRTFLSADSAIIILEILAMLVFLICASGDTIAQLSTKTLVSGDLSDRFFIGFVGCGLVIPLVTEIVAFFAHKAPRAAIGFLGGCILIGGFYLRSCIISAGIHVSALMFAGI